MSLLLLFKDCKKNKKLVIEDFMFSEGNRMGEDLRYRISDIFDRRLRNEDIALNEFVKEQLNYAGLENINVIDGYPQDKALTIPLVAVEHNYTIDNEVEIGDKLSEIRAFKLKVYAPTNGYRDEILDVLGGLYKREFFTLDNRQIEILNVKVDKENNDLFNTVSKHTNYRYLEFDGETVCVEYPYWAYYAYNPMTIEADVDIKEQEDTGIRYLFSLGHNFVGTFIYLLDNSLNFYMGLSSSTALINSIDYTPYLGLRVRLNIQYSYTFVAKPKPLFKHTSKIYINGDLISTVNIFSFLETPVLQSKIVVGVDEDYGNYLKMNLYGFRLAYDILQPDLGQEKLATNQYDIFLYTFEEVFGSNILDRRKVQDESLVNSTVYGYFNRILYKTVLFPDRLYNSGSVTLLTKGVYAKTGE